MYIYLYIRLHRRYIFKICIRLSISLCYCNRTKFDSTENNKTIKGKFDYNSLRYILFDESINRLIFPFLRQM